MTGETINDKKTIYLARHGESDLNRVGRIGGDGNITDHGTEFAQMLADYFVQRDISDLITWTSTFKRTKQTARFLKTPPVRHLAGLDEINAGVCEGMTYEEIAEKYPREMALRDQNKYSYKYQLGESYEDVTMRVAPVVEEMKLYNNLLVICHQAVARCIFGLLLNESPDCVPYILVPLHTLFKLTFVDGLLQNMETITLPADHVETHRAKPKNVSDNRTIDDALETAPHHEPDLTSIPAIQQRSLCNKSPGKF